MGIFDRMIAAREKQARRYVAGILSNLDDDTIARAGYTREQLKRAGSTNYYL